MESLNLVLQPPRFEFYDPQTPIYTSSSVHTTNTMRTSQAIKVAAIAAPVALLAAATANAASDSCISLKGSSMCPSFQNNFVKPSNLSSEYGFFDTVTDVASFDSLFQYYLTS